MVNEIQFMNYARNITGSTFIKNFSLTDNYCVINFYSSFDEYKNDNPNSLITKKDYKEYFETGKNRENPCYRKHSFITTIPYVSWG